MRTLKYILMIIGLVLSLMGALRLLGFLSSIITTDKAFLLVFFAGMTISCMGFWIDEHTRVPRSHYQVEMRRKNKRSMFLSTIMGFILIVLVTYCL